MTRKAPARSLCVVAPRGSRLELALLLQCKAAGLPDPAREVALLEGRRFRADFVWREARLVVEVQGGTYVRGRHSRPRGQRADCEKLNLLQLDGWRVLQVTRDQIANGQALGWICAALGRVASPRILAEVE